MLLSDTHTHTRFSTDSSADPKESFQAAIQKNLALLCFTDHMDLDFPGDASRFVFDPEEYFRELLPLKEASLENKGTKLLLGIELGQRPGRPDLIEQMDALLLSHPYDFVIGSTHIVDEMDPYEPEYWEYPGDRLLRYFETVYENTKEHTNFDSLGHLDYIIRYLPKNYSPVRDYRVSDYWELLSETLHILVQRGQALEINTAGLRKGLAFLHPKKELLLRYKELGGELVTLGSDAHTCADIGADIKTAAEFLRSCGYSRYFVYKERKPVAISLNSDGLSSN